MLEHEVDAVLIASPAFKHATDAIAALDAGKHVLSEVTACWTMAGAAGHGGSDYFAGYDFIRAVKDDAPPAIDVRTGLEMTMPGWKA